ncbi:type I polyketide synthase [Streptomyces enissocaesilis]|uniref:Type I polyketide synthase n=1 Tax=Streptomyces enissocaesilis TaxID=332589 RepID=A0ABN3XNT4_9ACTN
MAEVKDGLAGRGESVAIVGMGLRLAGGVRSADDLWQVMSTGRDVVGLVPEGRFAPYAAASPAHSAGVARTWRRGAFLDDVAGFDASFFGVSPREAESMDPQHRLLLETAWEALEDAGIPPEQLAGRGVGVYVGIGPSDYGRLLLEDLPGMEPWNGIGAAACAAANRVSYALDLRGPSLAIDTACSASLVAVHMACQALKAGEAEAMLVGGVNVATAPGPTLTLQMAGALSPDGRSRPFDENANGYGRGEGAAVLVLKRLSDAQRDGDRVLAVICAGAVAQDGRTNGIMEPSGEAQAALLQRVYADSGIDPLSIGYVEAHGTGTRAGDPVEARALADVLGAGRPSEEPCLIGAVKSHVGHLEAGAGVVSVIAAVLSLQHRVRVPVRGPMAPNPAIPWGRNGLRLPTELMSWPRPSMAPRRAAVSGFGYGGTIAHLVLEEAPEADPTHLAVSPSRNELTKQFFAVSGRDPEGVRATCQSLADWLEQADDVNLDDVAHTLMRGRAHLPCRAAVGAETRSELIIGLRGIAQQQVGAESAEGRCLPHADRGAVWVFSGHGSQWTGMGAELLRQEPAFAKTIQQLNPIYKAEAGYSVLESLNNRHDPTDVGHIQALIFAVQVGLAATLRDYGARPAAVVGHSVGEIAAAVTAGALTLEEGARLICRRSKLISPHGGTGAMAMVDLPFAKVQQSLQSKCGIDAAIEASPDSTVVSGSLKEVTAAAGRWRAEGHAVRAVASDTPFHSAAMEASARELGAGLDDLSPTLPHTPLYSTAREPQGRHHLDGDYWADNLRNPVRLASAVQAAADDGYTVFLEVAPHPVVSHSIAQTLESLGTQNVLVQPTLRRNQPEQAQVISAVAALYCAQVPLQTERLAHLGKLISLPPRAWRHRPFWRLIPPPTAASARLHDVANHCLLGGKDIVAGTTVWRTYLDEATKPYPQQHQIHGTEIVPAAVLAHTLLCAAEEATGSGVIGLHSVDFRVPLALNPAREVQVNATSTTLSLSSRLPAPSPAALEGWLTHTTAGIAYQARTVHLAQETPGHPVPVDTVQQLLRDRGVDGMAFAWKVEQLHQSEQEVQAQVTLCPAQAVPHRAEVLDAALTLAIMLHADDARLRMPSRARHIRLTSQPSQRVILTLRRGDRRPTVDILVSTPEGQVVGWIDGLRCDPVEPEDSAEIPHMVHALQWQATDTPSPAERPPTCVTMVGSNQSVRRALDAFDAFGVQRHYVTSPTALRKPVCRHQHPAVVVAPPTDTTTDPLTLACRASELMARTVQAVASWPADHRPRIWAMTCGVRTAEATNSVGQAALWGMARVAAEEEPDLWAGLIDLDLRQPEQQATTLLHLLGCRILPEPLISLDGAQILRPRLAPASTSATRPELGCRPDGTYLITGGLGALGREVALWLADRGARRLILASRTGLPPRHQWDIPVTEAMQEKIQTVRRLEELGATVHTPALDITDAAQCSALLDTAHTGLPPIRGIVHAAGFADGQLLRATTLDAFQSTLKAKVGGAMVLHELFPPGSVDFFALFSSCGHLLGIPGQSAYGAANACLDALAHLRARFSDDTLSLAWTSWRSLGMGDNPAVEAELRSRSVGTISPHQAFMAWGYAARRMSPYQVVMPLRPLPSGATVSPLLQGLTYPNTAPTTSTVGSTPYAHMDPTQLRSSLRGTVRQVIRKVTGIPDDDLDDERPLPDYGVDSVMSLAIRNNLNAITGLALSASVLWRHPTVTALTLFSATQLQQTHHVATAPGGTDV